MAEQASEGVNEVYDSKTVGKALGDLDKQFEKLESEKGSYMSRCKGIREDIAAIYKRADDKGVPQRELKALQTLRIKKAKLLADLEKLDALEQRGVRKAAEAAVKAKQFDAEDMPLFRFVPEGPDEVPEEAEHEGATV